MTLRRTTTLLFLTGKERKIILTVESLQKKALVILNEECGVSTKWSKQTLAYIKDARYVVAMNRLAYAVLDKFETNEELLVLLMLICKAIREYHVLHVSDEFKDDFGNLLLILLEGTRPTDERWETIKLCQNWRDNVRDRLTNVILTREKFQQLKLNPNVKELLMKEEETKLADKIAEHVPELSSEEQTSVVQQLVTKCTIEERKQGEVLYPGKTTVNYFYFVVIGSVGLYCSLRHEFPYKTAKDGQQFGGWCVIGLRQLTAAIATTDCFLLRIDLDDELKSLFRRYPAVHQMFGNETMAERDCIGVDCSESQFMPEFGC